MGVTLTAARRLGAIHHRLEPTGHVHVQHLVTADEIMLLSDRDRLFSYISPLGSSGVSHGDWFLTSSWRYFGLFL